MELAAWLIWIRNLCPSYTDSRDGLKVGGMAIGIWSFYMLYVFSVSILLEGSSSMRCGVNDCLIVASCSFVISRLLSLLRLVSKANRS